MCSLWHRSEGKYRTLRTLQSAAHNCALYRTCSYTFRNYSQLVRSNFIGVFSSQEKRHEKRKGNYQSTFKAYQPFGKGKAPLKFFGSLLFAILFSIFTDMLFKSKGLRKIVNWKEKNTKDTFIFDYFNSSSGHQSSLSLHYNYLLFLY